MGEKLTEHELTVLVDRAAEGAWDSMASMKMLPSFRELSLIRQNEIREQALPFIYHGTKALHELGFRRTEGKGTT